MIARTIASDHPVFSICARICERAPDSVRAKRTVGPANSMGLKWTRSIKISRRMSILMPGGTRCGDGVGRVFPALSTACAPFGGAAICVTDVGGRGCRQPCGADDRDFALASDRAFPVQIRPGSSRTRMDVPEPSRQKGRLGEPPLAWICRRSCAYTE